MTDPTRPPRIPPIPSFSSTLPLRPAPPYVPPILQPIADPLLDWLARDLSAENLHRLLMTPFFRMALKNARPQSLPREKAVALLRDSMRRNVAVRMQALKLWKARRQSEMEAFDSIADDQLPAYLDSAVKQFGGPAVYWRCLASQRVAFQKAGADWARQAAERGELKEISEKKFAFGREDELKELKDRCAKLEESRKALEAQVQYEKNALEKSRQELSKKQSEARALQKELEQARAEIQRERQEAAASEEKLKTLGSASKTIRSLEKRIEDLERERRAEAQRAEDFKKDCEARQAAEEERSEDGRMMEKTLSALFEVFSAERKLPEVLGVSQNVLVVGESEFLSKEYFESASARGLSLSYHRGFQRDSDLQKKVSLAGKVVLFLPVWRDLKRWGDLVGYLRKREIDLIVLPPLSPEQLSVLL